MIRSPGELSGTSRDCKKCFRQTSCCCINDGCLVVVSLGWGWGENVVDHMEEVRPIVKQGMIHQMKYVHSFLSTNQCYKSWLMTRSIYSMGEGEVLDWISIILNSVWSVWLMTSSTLDANIWGARIQNFRPSPPHSHSLDRRSGFSTEGLNTTILF